MHGHFEGGFSKHLKQSFSPFFKGRKSGGQFRKSLLLVLIYLISLIASAGSPQTVDAAPLPAQQPGQMPLTRLLDSLFGKGGETVLPERNNYKAPTQTGFTNGGLSIQPITAYNLIVDSNVLSPSTYGPSAATLGAKFCNNTAVPMNSIWAYIGSFDTVSNTGTPGVYPVRTPGSISENPGLSGATATDFGADDNGANPGRLFSLKHQSGSVAPAVDASRYIGSLAAGECRVQYWLVSYPRKALVGGSWVTVTGGVKPDDDLWLSYYFWATSNTTGAAPSYTWRPVTMRNEISAAANKIWPNGDNKVPTDYRDLVTSTVGWDTRTPNGTGTVYPGQVATSEGIWYDFGNVGAGFDNNYDLTPDRNAWVQPIGDAGIYDPGCFRLVKTHGVVIVKLNDGTNKVIQFEDKLYFENIPDNNNGAVGLVYYDYIALDGACTAGLTPYQEVASGYDNEKFNGDFGSGTPPLQTVQTNLTLDKNGDPTVAAGGVVNYTLTFTLPQADAGATSFISVGNPSLGMPLVYEDTVPAGMTYIANSASPSVTGANLPSNPMPATVLYSTDSGATWSAADPGSKLSAAPNNLVKIQWWLSDSVTQKASSSVTGTVSFKATAPGGATPPPAVTNTGCLKMGSGPCFTQDSFTTLITGPYSISGSAFCDDGSKYSGSGPCANTAAGGTYANGIREATTAEPGIPSVSVELYYDANGNGVIDSGEIKVAVQDTTATGAYSFSSLPAGNFIVKVIKTDPDVQPTYGLTTSETRKAANTTANVSGLDFGFAPPLTVSKSLATNGTINIGELFNYTLTIRNNLPGGSGTANSCTYTIWSSKYVLDNSGQPNGGNAANAQFQNAAAVTGLPDSNNAYTNLANADNLIGIKGFNTDPSTLPGAITGVKALLKVSEKSNLATDAQVIVNPYYNGNGAGTTPATSYAGSATGTPFTGAGFFTGPTGTSYDLTYDLFGLKSWTAADFTLDNTALQVKVGKGAGSNSGTLNVDAAALLVTTNQPCPSTPDTTLNPAPLTDAFPTAYMDFVSSNPPASSVNEAGGTLSWNNIGPIPAGSYRQVTVTFRATATATNQVNTAASSGGKFANGLSANADSATAQVTISSVVSNGQISGEIFDDNNLDGWKFAAACTAGSGATCALQGGDTAIQGARVNLYACVKTDGTLETSSGNKTCAGQTAGNEWLVWQTAYTDSAGHYAFPNLRQGFYRVIVDTASLPGSVQTADPNATGVCAGAACDSQSNIDDNTNAITLGTINNNTITNVNFGYNAPNTQSGIGDEVYYDWNGNGIRDAGDEIISGVTLKLLDTGNTLLTTATTDPAQAHPYAFNQTNGIYTVKVDANTLPAIPLTQTGDPDQSGMTCTNCDGAKMFTLNGAANWSLDFGYQPQGLGAIGDTVYRDINGDGVQSGVQEVGIANIGVSLLADMNNDGTWVTVKTTTTDSKGGYLFSGLPDGNFRVVIDTADSDLPKDAFGVGYRSTTLTAYQVRLSGGLGTDIGPVGSPAACAGDCALNADFGFAPLAALGDTVYLDINGNGTQDFNEPGIAGVKVDLYPFADTVTANNKYTPGEPLGTLAASATTDANGRYLFTALTPGLYVAVVDTTTGGLTGKAFTGDPDADGISCATTPEPFSGFYAQCDSRNGMRLFAGTNYMGADFGYQPRGVIGDTLWLDSDSDGVLDPGETGIPYVGIKLTGGSCSPCTVQTDVNGTYLFGNLADGTYTLSVDTADSDFPAGLVSTYDPDALHNGATTFIISGGMVTALGGNACTNCSLNADFGYRYSGAGSLSGTLCSDSLETGWDGLCGGGTTGVGTGEGAFTSMVVDLFRWNDANNDGMVTPAELTRVGSTATNASGDYAFSSVPDNGLYVVSISAPLTDLKLTTITGSSPTVGNDAKEQVVDQTASGTGVYQVVHLGPSENAQNVDFAFTTKNGEDFGDLPASYSTTLQGVPDAARHVITTGLSLGAAPDADENGLVSPNATGDNLNNQNDEDGVTINPLDADWSDGTGAVRVNVTGSGYLAGWVDFNKDGDFKDTGEMVISQAVSAGANQALTFPVPAGTFASPSTVLNARFRLFPSAPLYPQYAYSGQASGGEVEDYQYTWNMQIDLDVDPHLVAPNGQTTYQLTLANNGSQPLTGIQANIPLPAGFSLVSYTAPGGVTCSGPNAVTCTGLALNPGESVVITLAVKAGPTAGTYQTDATATANEFDAGVTVTDSGTTSDTDTLANIGAFETDPATDEDVTVQNLATIGDRVWNDSDHDGIQDVGEPGLPGVTVHLLDGATAAVLQTTVTGANGIYTFSAPAGTYKIEVVAPTYYQFSPANAGADDTIDSDTLPADGRTAAFTLVDGQTDSTWDAGLYQPLITLGDRVWEDQNQNGIQDAGEPGLAGARVNLLDGSGNLVSFVSTGVNGDYSFIVPAGAYALEFVKPAGYTRSPANSGSDDTLDSDADLTSGKTASITLVPGQTDITLDAGFYLTPTQATVGDLVWNDLNQNGLQDAGEGGITGVTVRLLDGATSAVLQTTTTDGSGHYQFSAMPGSYVIEFVAPANTDFTMADFGGNDSLDSDANHTTGRTAVITLASGQNDLTWDAGLYSTDVTIGDFVWNDRNHDGIQDAGEPGLDGVTVNLMDSTGKNVLQSTTTSGGGLYSFTAPFGTYQIQFVTPAGYAYTLTNQGNAAADSNAQGPDGLTGSITVKMGRSDLDWDAGFYQPASIGDRVWNDLNHDGIQDAGEPGLAGVTVKLFDSGGAPVTSTTTSPTGIYSFSIPSGSYILEFVAPTGYANTVTGQGTTTTDSDAQTGTGRTSTITVNPGQNDTSWDAGFYQPATIGDRVWDDRNHNGIQDAGEPGLESVNVYLLDSTAANVIDTTMTDANGIYHFTVPSGAYVIMFDWPSGYNYTLTGQGTPATDSNADPSTGQTDVFTVNPGQVDNDWDAGLYQPANIGNKVWEDLNGNGIQDNGEYGLDDVTVNLLDSTGTTLLDSIVTADGGYYSFTVPAGSYIVEFVAPDGYVHSPAHQGADDAQDSDADITTGRTPIITMTPGQDDSTWDAGLYQPATIGDRVWNDLDQDGVQDLGEPSLSGITIRLLDSATHAELLTTTSGTNGAYQFSVPAGSYVIEFSAPAGFMHSPIQQGSDTAADSDAAAATGQTGAISVTVGQTDLTWDAGFYQPTADLHITKTDGVTSYTPGSGLTYTIKATNSGPGDVTGAVISDALPAGIMQWTWTCVQANGATGCDGITNSTADFSDTVDLPAGGSITYTVTASTDPAATADLTNTAAITPPNGVNDPTDDNSATDTDTAAPQADLQIQKDDGTDIYIPGGSLTYTITVTNHGPSNVTGATVTDNLPAQILQWQFTCAAGSNSTCDGTTGFTANNFSDVIDLAVGESITYTVSAQLDPSRGDTLNNTARVTPPANIPDPDLKDPGSENDVTDSDEPLYNADLSVTKDDGVTSYTPGGSLTYTIVVRNSGPSDVTGATFSDPIPAQISQWSWGCVAAGGASGCAGVSNSTSDFTNVVDLPAGSTITYTVTAVTASSASGSLTNTATIEPAWDVTDPTPENNSDDDIDAVTVSADLSISKTDGTVTYTPGGSLTYTIVASNSGPSDVTGVVINDALPSQITQWTWTCAQAGGASGCDGVTNASADFSDTVDLPAGSSITYTVVAQIDPAAAGSLANTAGLTAPVSDPTPDDHSATDTDTPAPVADLEVTKTDGTGIYVPGGSLTYTIVVTNHGPSSVTSASLTDVKPAQVTQWQWTCGAGSNSTCTGTSGLTASDFSDTFDLAVGESITYTVDAQLSASASGSLANTAHVEPPASTTDPDTKTPGSQNDSTDTDTPQVTADLTISKDDGVTSYTPGGTVTYTIVVENNGPSDVTGAVVTDPKPAEISHWSWTCVMAGGASGCGGQANSTSDFSDIVDLPVGSSITYTVTAATHPSATAALTNTAHVDLPAGGVDPTPENNTDDDIDSPAASADLGITKTDGVQFYTPGGTLTYTITVTNNGLSDVKGAPVTDNLPAGLANATWTCAPAAACAAASGSGSINTTVDLPASGSATFTLLATVANPLTGNLTNAASIATPPGVSDPNPGNDSDSDTDLNPPTPQVDLVITKTDGVASYVPGGTLTYTITVTNNSLTDVSSATVTDNRPAEITQWAWACGQTTNATCDGQPLSTANFTDTVDLKAGEVITYTVTAQVDPAAMADLINTATVTPPSIVTDPTPENNSDTDQDTAAPQADLTLTKTADTALFSAGATLTYTLKVENLGPSDAQNVVVSDPLPSQVRFISATPAPVDSTAAVLTWNLGTIKAKAAPVIITLVVQVNENVSEAFTNTAGVSTTTPEPNTGNNDDSSTVNPEAPTPVTLLYFNVKAQGPKTVVAKWAAATEVDTFGYRLMRAEKDNLASAVEVAFVPIDPLTRTYQVTDSVTGKGRYYYWLVVVDTNGKEAVGRSASVNMAANSNQIFLPGIRR